MKILISDELPALFLMPIFFLIAVIATYSLSHSAQGHKWYPYYICLVSVPFAFFALKKKAFSADMVQWVLGTFLLIGIALEPGKSNQLALFTGGACSMLIVYFLNKRQELAVRYSTIFFLGVLGCLSWQLSYRLTGWWDANSLAETLRQMPSLLFASTALVGIVLFQTLFGVAQKRHVVFDLILTTFSVLVLFYLCGRPYELNDSFMLHQSFYVGPVELIKQGGTLLWDVPSQYGLLGVYLAAKIKIGSTWQSFMFLNKVCIFFGLILLYFFLRQTFKSLIGNLFSLIITIFSIFYWIGYLPEMVGPFQLPSVGAFRFIWCYLMMWCCYLRTAGNARAREWGKIFWLISIFWSIEIAICTTAIWLTFNFFEGLQNANPVTFRGIINSFGRTVAMLVYPFGAIIVVSGIYFLFNAHAPDWRNYIEYLQAYKAGFGSLPVDSAGAVWTLLAIFIAGGMAALFAIYENSRYAPFIAADVVFLWAVGSYYNSRSHENNILNLIPLIVLFIAGTLIATRSLKSNPLFRTMLFVFLLPFFTVIIAAPAIRKDFGKAIPSPADWHFLNEIPTEASIQGQYEKDVRAINACRLKFGITDDQPVVFLSTTLPALPTDIKQTEYWLPLAPEAQFEILKYRRQQVYMQRFVDRKKRGGWIFQKNDDPNKYRLIFKLIDKRFLLVDTRTSGNWIAKKYAYRDKN